MTGDSEAYLPYIKWIPPLILLCLGIYAIIRKILDKRLLETVTRSNRGTRSERALVLKLLKHGIPSQTIFHDLYLRKSDGEFSQIDVVVATKTGIVVFEVKDYSGWIFGNGKNREWTQVLAYGREKHRFYNPIMQNNKHITEIRKKSRQFQTVPFYSVVVFYGNCELKDISFIPHGTYIVKSTRVSDALDMILKTNEPARYTDKHEVVEVLKEAVNNGNSKAIQSQHIENIRDMLWNNRVYR